ncbi:MAG: SET domain-containing protein [Bacteroidia bacterium]
MKFINSEIGYGVVATKFIPAGTITWALDKLDREFSLEDFQNMEPIYQAILDTYTYRNSKGNFVLCWDHGRYVNHSFNSNCLTTAYDFEIAIRDIQVGEQLTDDYGYLNIQSPFRSIDEGTKRKVVYPNDLLRYHKVWDNKIKKVFNKITKLNQPLRPLFSQESWKRIEKIINGDEQMLSILSNYYDDKSALQKHRESVFTNGRFSNVENVKSSREKNKR